MNIETELNKGTKVTLEIDLKNEKWILFSFN
jgi:hypothetical protein